MGKHPVFTISGLIVAVAAAPLLFVFHLQTAAAITATVGYFIAMKDFSKFTGWLQFTTQLYAGAITGICLDYPFDHIPFLALSMVFITFATFGRIIFFRFFAYTGKTWFEISLLILAVGCHFAGNMMRPGNILGWTLPAPALIFGGIITWGILKDKRQLLASTMKGYKIAIGSPAPAFSLPDQSGETVSLSDFTGERHLLLIFVRGDWCPGCHMMLRTYQKESHHFKEKNVFVLSIGPDPVGVNKEMVERLALDFKVLADDGQKVAMKYGVQLQEYDNAFAEKYDEGIPLPASFLVDKNGIVRYVSRPDRVGEFLNPSLIFPIVEKLN
ncbi:MAG TPA: redoxin domain-containing protein [Bacteroidia bacterium]|jgi:peroxiredoxin|nr:redoxin domain-containing protein [Bacteroidia bacterium]